MSLAASYDKQVEKHPSVQNIVTVAILSLPPPTPSLTFQTQQTHICLKSRYATLVIMPRIEVNSACVRSNNELLPSCVSLSMQTPFLTSSSNSTSVTLYTLCVYVLECICHPV